MSSLLYSLIALVLWAIQRSYGRVLSQPTQRPREADRDRPLVQTRMVEIPELRLRQLAKRQQTSLSNAVFTVTIATDETCGWLSGSPGSPITCQNHQPCMWAGSLGIICGVPDKPNDWEVHVRCVERAVALNTALCNDVCESNSFFLRCTDSSAAYCRTYAYPEGIVDFRCAPTPVARVQSVSFTYDGQHDAGFLTSTYTDINSQASSTKPVSSTTSHPPPLPPPPSHTNHSNTGAIVGGAVGGFVAVSLVAFAIFWFVRRRKTAHAQQVAPPMEGAPVEQGPPNGAALNAAKASPSPSSAVQSEWRDSMMTVLSPGSNPTSPQAWLDQPVSPGDQSVLSEGVSPPVAHEMSGGSVQPRVYEMSGDPAHPQVYRTMGDRAHPRVYEMTGDNSYFRT
ncbi:hypothetical protein AUP68_09348 [Ilyonectria robusta]